MTSQPNFVFFIIITSPAVYHGKMCFSFDLLICAAFGRMTISTEMNWLCLCLLMSALFVPYISFSLPLVHVGMRHYDQNDSHNYSDELWDYHPWYWWQQRLYCSFMNMYFYYLNCLITDAHLHIASCTVDECSFLTKFAEVKLHPHSKQFPVAWWPKSTESWQLKEKTIKVTR